MSYVGNSKLVNMGMILDTANHPSKNIYFDNQSMLNASCASQMWGFAAFLCHKK